MPAPQFETAAEINEFSTHPSTRQDARSRDEAAMNRKVHHGRGRIDFAAGIIAGVVVSASLLAS
jgi:hypothetical protein